MRFVDTNVLLYAVSTVRDEAGKAAVARATLEANDLCLSVQVLEEFYVQATRASRSDRLSHRQAANLVEAFARFPVKSIDLPLLEAALETRSLHRISLWDAAILEAARAMRCDVVLSEDLSHGHDYDGVRVENPFASLV